MRPQSGDQPVGVGSAPVDIARTARRGEAHPILSLVARRSLLGLITLFAVSVLVFLATQVLPGNAAIAVLGQSATPARVQALEQQLHLDRGLFDQYWTWLSGSLTGRLGNSLANGLPVC
jgi:peptide/nickel transport system permease protein